MLKRAYLVQARQFICIIGLEKYIKTDLTFTKRENVRYNNAKQNKKNSMSLYEFIFIYSGIYA